MNQSYSLYHLVYPKNNWVIISQYMSVPPRWTHLVQQWSSRRSPRSSLRAVRGAWTRLSEEREMCKTRSTSRTVSPAWSAAPFCRRRTSDIRTKSSVNAKCRTSSSHNLNTDLALRGPSGKLPFECQKNAKNLTFFQKKIAKIFHFFKKIVLTKMTILAFI